jgi:hypothetical protein
MGTDYCQHTRRVASENYRLCFGIAGNWSTAQAWIWLWGEKEELVIVNLSQDRMIEVVKINKPPPHLPMTRRPLCSSILLLLGHAVVDFDFPVSECPLWIANPLGAFGKDCHLEHWIT